MKPNTHERLRESFEAMCCFKSNMIGKLDDLERQQIANFWLSQLDQELTSLVEEGEKLKTKPIVEQIPCPDGIAGCCVYHVKTILPPENRALEDFITLIKSRMSNNN